MAKSTRPMVRIHNTQTDEVIDREMNDDELAAYEADVVAATKRQAEEKLKSEEKQAIAARLGLTADELKLLLG